MFLPQVSRGGKEGVSSSFNGSRVPRLRKLDKEDASRIATKEAQRGTLGEKSPSNIIIEVLDDRVGSNNTPTRIGKENKE